MDECPCDPALLFRDGDVYEEEEEEGEEKGGGLTLVRRDGGGGVVERGRVGGAAGPGAREVEDLFTADDLASDVGGLDGQLEDIVRRVLSTRTIPAEVRRCSFCSPCTDCAWADGRSVFLSLRVCHACTHACFRLLVCVCVRSVVFLFGPCVVSTKLIWRTNVP